MIPAYRIIYENKALKQHEPEIYDFHIFPVDASEPKKQNKKIKSIGT